MIYLLLDNGIDEDSLRVLLENAINNWKIEQESKQVKNIILKDKWGNELGRFATVYEASEITNIPMISIKRCLDEKVESVNGLYWSLEE